MSDARYVYTTHEMDLQRSDVVDIEAVINEYAREGWRLTETLEDGGTTVGLLFEREV